MFHSKPWVYAFKVSLGNAFCMLFVLVSQMNYFNSSLVSTLYIIAATLVADTPHIGSNMTAAFVLLWSGIYGSVSAAAVLMIGVGNIGIILISCFIVLPLFILLRFSGNPKCVSIEFIAFMKCISFWI